MSKKNNLSDNFSYPRRLR